MKKVFYVTWEYKRYGFDSKEEAEAFIKSKQKVKLDAYQVELAEWKKKYKKADWHYPRLDQSLRGITSSLNTELNNTRKYLAALERQEELNKKVVAKRAKKTKLTFDEIKYIMREGGMEVNWYKASVKQRPYKPKLTKPKIKEDFIYDNEGEAHL